MGKRYFTHSQYLWLLCILSNVVFNYFLDVVTLFTKWKSQNVENGRDKHIISHFTGSHLVSTTASKTLLSSSFESALMPSCNSTHSHMALSELTHFSNSFPYLHSRSFSLAHEVVHILLSGYVYPQKKLNVHILTF